ncbi:MAG: peptidylprolyl isomerase [Pseudomonadota bacterium]
MQIGPRTVAQFHYTLTDDAGQVIDSSRGAQPLTYLHGGGQIVPGLEKMMEGKVKGDSFKVEVSPEEGYGPRIEALLQTAPRSMFPPDMEPEVGMQFQAESNMGPVMVTVMAVEGDTVTLDGNHALAGQTLHFDVEVSGVREASVEEVLHGHAHGEGGHHH